MAKITYFNLTIFCTLQIRKGIVEVFKEKPLQEDFDLIVTTTSDVWRGILTNEKSALAANVVGGLKCTPNILRLRQFMKYFDTPLQIDIKFNCSFKTYQPWYK